jgi:hypothetical protein
VSKLPLPCHRKSGRLRSMTRSCTQPPTALAVTRMRWQTCCEIYWLIRQPLKQHRHHQPKPPLPPPLDNARTSHNNNRWQLHHEQRRAFCCSIHSVARVLRGHGLLKNAASLLAQQRHSSTLQSVFITLHPRSCSDNLCLSMNSSAGCESLPTRCCCKFPTADRCSWNR